MKRTKLLVTVVSLGIWVFAVLLPGALCAGSLPHPETYIPSIAEIISQKGLVDDPRPLIKNFGPSVVCPKEILDCLSNDIEKAKSLWSELVGFKAPDVVGKLYPEIKPGKYTWQDVQNNQSLKDLIAEGYLNRIRQGGPPHVGTFPEFEIIPTRQFYWGLPIAEATKKHLGKTKLDNQGFIVMETREAGYPFPKPSGKFKPQQILYNHFSRYGEWGWDGYFADKIHGYDKNLREDLVTSLTTRGVRAHGRVLFEPYGWLNERAKKRGEWVNYMYVYEAPRDVAGTVFLSLSFLSKDKLNQDSIYLPSMRRIRRLSGTDTQEPMTGMSVCVDDIPGIGQKMHPTSYPMSYEILSEREYLIPAPTEDGGEWISSEEGYALKNQKFERRPLYVLLLTELDPNYVYSKRRVYIDQETFLIYQGDNWDQKGRKYRTYSMEWGWFPEFGLWAGCGGWLLQMDHVDIHSEINFTYSIPAAWRAEDISLRTMMQNAK